MKFPFYIYKYIWNKNNLILEQTIGMYVVCICSYQSVYHYPFNLQHFPLCCLCFSWLWIFTFTVYLERIYATLSCSAQNMGKIQSNFALLKPRVEHCMYTTIILSHYKYTQSTVNSLIGSYHWYIFCLRMTKW